MNNRGWMRVIFFFSPRTFFPKKSCTRSQCTNYGGRKVHEVQGDSAARRQAAGERGRKCFVRSPEKVTQVQGVPINVGSVREGEGEETRCESTGGCEGKQGRPAGDIRSGGTRAQER